MEQTAKMEAGEKEPLFKLYGTEREKRFLKIVWRVLLVLTVCLFWIENISYIFSDDIYYEDDTYAVEEADCNTVGIELRGFLVTYTAAYADPAAEGEEGPDNDLTASEEVVSILAEADSDPAIKAILLEVDSGGGSPVAAEEIAAAIKRVEKPVVAYIRETGASAAYWAASAADRIFASPSSDVGSIGVTCSYLDNAAKNEKEGLNYNQLSTGQFKDMYDPDKPLTPAERALAERDLGIVKDNFIGAVATNRKLEAAKVRALADGSTLPGTLAVERGLVDTLGNYGEVREYLKELLGEEAEICWY